MRIVRVPLAVDAQIRVPFGPMLLPLRAVLLMGAASPLALLGMNAGSFNASFRVAVALTVLSVAFTMALPLREGVWVGTWLLYRHLARLLPASVQADAGRRRSARNLAGAVRITSVPRWRSLARAPLP